MLILPAHAKLNLALEVVRRRPDGFHDIASVVAPIDWHDIVGVQVDTDFSALRVTGAAALGVPGAVADEGFTPPGDEAKENLAVRAARAMNEAAAGRLGHSHLHAVWLDKRIPAGAGLGGGSADAAAVVRAGRGLFARHGIVIDDGCVSAIAAGLGSDVPALLAGRPVRVAGTGDVLAPADVPVLHVVVVFLEPGVTGAAYQAVTPDEMSDGDRVNRLLEELHAGTLPSDAVLGSALERPALRVNPVLAAAVSRLREAAPVQRWHMTGSGGAYFAVVDDATAAGSAAERLRRAGFLARACRTLRGAAAGG